jgi:hypothetical protein
MSSIKKTQFVFGFIIIVIGFLAYRFGVAINLTNNSIVSELVKNYAPSWISLAQMGLILEFGGGIILLLGILIALAALITTKEVHYPPVKTSQEKVDIEIRRCKFCSAELDEGIVFCTVCGKSQE